MSLSRATSNDRRAASVVEFTVIAPVFFTLVFGLIEFSRMVMCYQVMTSAAREAARVGALPGATSNDAVQRANNVLAAGVVGGASVIVSPSDISGLDQGQSFTVTVEGPYNSMGWLPLPQWLGGRQIQSSVTMIREGK